MNRRWIVTGANGYLGGQLCMALHRRGDSVVGVARAGRSVNNLEDTGILCVTYEALPSILSSGDIFVHCAGMVGNSGDLEAFEKVNSGWAMSLFALSQEHGVDCFIYISSVAALGYKNRPCDAVLDESALPMHVDGELYGRSKLLAEQTLSGSAVPNSTRLVILRPGLIYGRRPFSSSCSRFRRPVVVDQEQRVPLVHIDNFSEAVVKVALHPEAQGVFFVVDEEQPTLREFNSLKMRYGLMQYSPLNIGKAGFWLIWLLRGFVRTMRGRGVKHLKDEAFADYCFQTRRLFYNTEKLRSLTEWMPLEQLDTVLRDSSPAPMETCEETKI
ncbi:NAD-dependent epimerase/dehydratase family protein [Desulfoluna spongiiphila]|uniref:NAD-dependent epimerase/dehydratase family protein n=1 Tax=Desulfoluna spongiiphila TaxID=419481 RepID=UPI001869EBD3|nr:NAD-dependent epimerase/dehydratase family protein [Desulfoluna spongiiphila]